MEPAIVALVAQLRSARRSQIRPASRRTLFALTIAAVLGLAHVARVGTPIARAVALAVLYPLCVWFAGVKRRNPAGWLRYL